MFLCLQAWLQQVFQLRQPGRVAALDQYATVVGRMAGDFGLHLVHVGEFSGVA